MVVTMNKTITMTGGGIVALVLIAAFAFIIPDLDFSPVDFAGYYGTSFIDPELDRELSEIRSMSMFYGVETNISHAESKHPGELDCMQKGDVFQVWENPFSKHCAEIYRIDENIYGVRIIAKIKGRFEEITAFIDDAENLTQVEEYLIRGGYTEIWNVW